MRKIVLLFLFLICRIYLSAQVFDQAIINILQTCIQQKQYEKADSIINSFRDKDLPENSVFWLNLIHSDVGVSRYRQSHDANIYLPYVQSGIDAFKYLSQHINKENASNSLDLWSFLFYWSDIFSQLDNKIIDSLSVFSNKYYNDYERRDHVLYYLVQRKIYKYYFDKKEWNKCINVMSQVENGISGNCSAIEQIAYSRFDIGQAYMNMKDFDSSEKWFVSSYSAFSKIRNKDDNQTYACLLLLSKIYFEHIRNFAKAYQFSLEAERVNKKLFGEASKAHIASLDFLAYSELSLGNNQKGIEHLMKIETLLQKTLDINEDEKQNYYYKLKLAYQRLNISNDIVLHDTIITENALLYKATNAYTHGNSTEAIERFTHLLKLYEDNFLSVEIANYIYVVESLSSALISEGYYNQADSLLNKAIKTIQDNSIDSPQIRGIYEAKGLLYYTINNVDMALYWYNQAKNMYMVEEERNLQYGMLISNLAMCEMAKENYSYAKILSEEAYEICVQFYGDNAENTNDRLLILNNLATINIKMQDFSKGKELYEEVVKSCVSNQHEATKALALLNLSEIYLLFEQDYKKAEESLLQVQVLDASSYVKDMAEFDLHFLHCITHSNNAIAEIAQYNESIKNHIANIFSYFSETEREDYWTQKSQALVFLNNLALSIFDDNQVKTMAFDNALLTKNMLLNSSRLLGYIVKNSADETKEMYSYMQTLKNTLSKKETPNDSISTYIEKISLLEKQIVSSIPDFGNRLRTLFKSCKDVQRMLSDNEIAIEFIFLPQIKTPFEESGLSYGALLLTKGDTIPRLIQLCSENDLKDLINTYTTMGQIGIDSLYAFSNIKLFHMVWKNLEPYIPIGATVYYSPTGHISNINLSAISNGHNRLAEVYCFHEVSTTALIGEIKQSSGINYKNAVIYGDINYYEDVDLMADKAKAYTFYSSGEVLTTRFLSRGSWDLLPETKEEVTFIGELLKANSLDVHVLTQNDANEESIKAFDSNAPELIHIATHGFYFSPEEDVSSSFFNYLHSYTQKDYSMHYSGLLFAGGNNVWTGKEVAEGVEDGILTADEISRLDLSDNKLIVLSACDTGLGDIDNVDGVFGLQRGLKRAGVKTILMSLWKVPDKETKELMETFYKELLSGKTPLQSLKLAQEHLKNEGKSPYYWAGFILLD